MQSDISKGRKTLVFCGTMASCRAVEWACSDRGVHTACYHGDMPLVERKAAIASFAGDGWRTAPPLGGCYAPRTLVSRVDVALAVTRLGHLDMVIHSLGGVNPSQTA